MTPRPHTWPVHPGDAARPPVRRGWRRPRVLVPVVVIAVLAVAGPALVAPRYAPPGEGGVAARPDAGWRLVVDAVRESRGARLGSGTSARERATEVWAGPPAIARSVRLVHSREPFAVEGPRLAGMPASFRVPTRSPLTWLVTGDVGPRRGVAIGALDYRAGVVVWDVRTRLSGRRP